MNPVPSKSHSMCWLDVRVVPVKLWWFHIVGSMTLQTVVGHQGSEANEIMTSMYVKYK